MTKERLLRIERKMFNPLPLAIFFLSLLINVPYLQATTCASIDYNRPTIATGIGHTVGLKEDGTVVAVGNNWYGQLNVSDWTNIKAVAAGLWHTVGLKEDGTVVAVGVTEDLHQKGGVGEP